MKALSIVNPKHSKRHNDAKTWEAVEYLCKCAKLTADHVKVGLAWLSLWFGYVLEYHVILQYVLCVVVSDTLLMLCVVVVLVRKLDTDERLATAREADCNLWAWYHRKDNEFFNRETWHQQGDDEKLALVEFVTFVFSVDVSSAFTESVFSITKGTKDPKRQRLKTEQVANYVRLGSLQHVPVRSILPKQLALNTLAVATYRRKMPDDDDDDSGDDHDSN